MAVSNQEVAAWLAANPQATDAQIAKAALDAGVSSQQLSQVTGVPVNQIEDRIRAVLPSIKPQIEERVIDMGEGTRSEYYIKGTNITVDAPSYFEDYSKGPLTESSVADFKQNNITIYDAAKGGEHVYTPEGQYLGFQEGARDSSLFGSIKEIAKGTAPIWSAALTAGGAAGALGSTLAPTLSSGAQAALGGALIGGGSAAVTGNDILKGAVIGGATSYLSDLLKAGITDQDLLQAAADADIAGGMVPEFGTNAAYDAFMQSAMTPAAQAAIETQIANSSVAGMTPEQILAQGNMITDIASGNVMGPMTADQLGTSFEEYMAQGGYTPVGDTRELGSTVTDTGTGLGSLTPAQIGNLVKAGVSVVGLAGAANAMQPSADTTTAVQTPTQGQPAYTPDYYNQLQQYYNAYMPQTPRDVVSPLQQWYEGSFGNTGSRASTAAAPQSQTLMPQTSVGTAMAPVQPTAPTPVPMSPTPVAMASAPAAASTGLFNTPLTAQQQVQNLLSSPNLSSLPPEAAAAISNAVSAPKNYNDVVASGGQNTVDVSSLSPEVQRAYDLYQQSMILGANSSEVRKAYERAGVDPTNPSAFFEGQGLLTGTPTQTALAQYAPLALDRFAESGGGALTYTVDPSTVPSSYTAPTIPSINFNMDRFVQSINNNTKINDATKQRLIAEQAAKRGFNPSEFI